MRFLKNKILLATQARLKKMNQDVSKPAHFLQSESQEFLLSPNAVETQPSTPEKKVQKKRTREPSSTKNLVINYGKAIASFAVSQLAVQYLEPLLKAEGVTLQEFIDFISQSKRTIGGIKSFRYLILTTPADTGKVVAFKKIFREIGAVFIKYFSVNWIMHGKVTHKITYLQYRFKMLRRIQDPENFTYVKQRNYKKSNQRN